MIDAHNDVTISQKYCEAKEARHKRLHTTLLDLFKGQK